MKKRKIIILIFILVFIKKIYAESKINNVNLYINNKTLYIDIKSSIDIRKEILNIIKKGLKLKLNYVIEIEDSKWYEFSINSKIKKSYILSYNKITKEYIIENPITYKRNYDKNIKKLISKIENIKKIPIKRIKNKNKNIKGNVQILLDKSYLPISLRIDTLTSSDWKINSKKVEWEIN